VRGRGRRIGYPAHNTSSMSGDHDKSDRHAKRAHHLPQPPRLLSYARRMRREPTDAEKKLWSRLRDRQIGGFKFRRQVPLGGYILDYFCKEAKLGVELDGGQHADAEEARYDAGRDEALRKLGVEVLRFPDDEAIKDTDAVLARILEIALARKALRE
jgi:very-short-patch-repair endonuclease